VNAAEAAASRAACTVRVTGVVQGVGFRPFVHRLALRHSLDGWVRNGADGVEILIEGAPDELEAFTRELPNEAPPLARIDTLDVVKHMPNGAGPFRVLASRDNPDQRQPVAPDVAMCAECERELYDPTNRRYRYAFITCTDCGPRYSLIERMPYDRERTSMRHFTQCDECAREYSTPGDRRYHSETNSCRRCGPGLQLLMLDRATLRDEAALAEAARIILDGSVVALRGLGGFHLVVDATNEAAVEYLRVVKRRDEKPFAVMLRSIDEVRAVADIDGDEEALIVSRERPIVVVKRGKRSSIVAGVAPEMATVGVMLAYTSLHHLLLDLVRRPLVMTSGNVSDEPLCAGIEEAQTRLRGIADAFLVHNREIVARVDDSVMRVAAGKPLVMRRARGIAPLPVNIPIPARAAILAVGAHLKNTIALAQDRSVFVSPHIGDLDTLETRKHFREVIERIARLHRIEPEVVAHDSHPGYMSTGEAQQIEASRYIAVQHHHAHVAAVCAEHGVTGPAVGVAFDGTGDGGDGTIWGAEVLVADLVRFERVAHLRTAPLPGGELAVRTPWRSALGYLSLDTGAADAFALAFEGVPEREVALARRQIEKRLNTPVASSMGRLFDAAAAVLGVRRTMRFEGQAAMQLEALAGNLACAPLPFPWTHGRDGCRILDPVPLLAALGLARQRGTDAGQLAAAFHEAIAEATAAVVHQVAEEHWLETVALGGGTFQNARLLASLCQRLTACGLRVLTPLALPPNDGAISYGQAAVAAARLAQEH
jgi:hydrogenase maturation protein HypF